MANPNYSDHTPIRFTGGHCGSFTADNAVSTTISNVSIASTYCEVFFSAKNTTGFTLMSNTATTRTIYTVNVSKAGNTFKVRHKTGLTSAKVGYVIFYRG